MTDPELVEEAAIAVYDTQRVPTAKPWEDASFYTQDFYRGIAFTALAVVDRARQDDWEYGIEYEIDSERSEFTLAHSERQARKWVAESPTDTGLRRRHPATEWEPVPDTEGSKK